MGNAILPGAGGRAASAPTVPGTGCRRGGPAGRDRRGNCRGASRRYGRLAGRGSTAGHARRTPPGQPRWRACTWKSGRFLASRWGGEQRAAKALTGRREVPRSSAGKEALAAPPAWWSAPTSHPPMVQCSHLDLRAEEAPQDGRFWSTSGYVSDTNKISPWLPGIFAVAEEKRFLVALPHGPAAPTSGIEQDVLTVIAETKRHYPVNADRFFLSGPSMGGYGVYVIGLHYPHLFAGLAPMCGRSVPYVVETRWPDDLPPFKRLAVAANVPLALVENAKNLPIFLQQGERDYLIDRTTAYLTPAGSSSATRFSTTSGLATAITSTGRIARTPRSTTGLNRAGAMPLRARWSTPPTRPSTGGPTGSRSSASVSGASRRAWRPTSATATG